MRISVLGAGGVGYAVAGALSGAGHQVVLAARSAQSPSLTEWVQEGREGADYATAVVDAELVVNATPGTASLDVLSPLSDRLDGLVLWDLANPLDFANGPAVLHPGGVSLGERLQSALPGTRVVKALNTVNTSVMTDPGRLVGVHEVLMCGNDDTAKRTVTGLLGDLGWDPDQVRDLGDITGARGTEMYLLLWIRLMSTLGTPTFNIHVAAEES